MRVGVGLPSTVPGSPGPRSGLGRAGPRRGPFASLGVLDRIVYDSLDPFVALAAAAAVTSGSRLVTMVVIGPIRTTALLAKQAALGPRDLGRAAVARPVRSGPGPRTTRPTGSRRPRTGRAACPSSSRPSARIWEDGPSAPGPGRPGGPTLLVGRLERAAVRPDGAVRPTATCTAAARPGPSPARRRRRSPRGPTSGGPGARAVGPGLLRPRRRRRRGRRRATCATTTPSPARSPRRIAAANLTSPEAVQDFVRGYEEAGCDELVLLPDRRPTSTSSTAWPTSWRERSPGHRRSAAGRPGLYLALLAEAGPTRATRSRCSSATRPDATFGWGVVFSEETLGALRDADRETYARDHRRLRPVGRHRRPVPAARRSARAGHVFSGIARRGCWRSSRPLPRARRRAGFEHEVADRPTPRPASTWWWRADGVRTRRPARARRRVRAPRGRPPHEVHLVRDRPGLRRLHVHLPGDRARPVPGPRVPVRRRDAARSSWSARRPRGERPGLDRMTEEESIAFCEELFAEELAGHRLMSNRSLWINFVTLRCESWHHGNVVLVGDAAHTAHFTIGSGTKLAMEDAIALADGARAPRRRPGAGARRLRAGAPAGRGAVPGGGPGQRHLLRERPRGTRVRARCSSRSTC